MSITPSMEKYKKNWTCVELPPNIHSSGFWSEDTTGTTIANEFETKGSTLPMLELKMVMTFLATHLFHLILGSFGLPFFISQMLAGFLLSSAVIGRIQFFENRYNNWIMSLASQDVLGTLTMFGYSMFLFLAAVKMDASLLLKTGRKAVYTGLFSLMVPLIVGICIVKLPDYMKGKNIVEEKDRVSYEHKFLIISISRTSFPVIVSLLGQLHILTSELGRLGLSAALVCDILTLTLITIVKAFPNNDEWGKLDSYKAPLIKLGYCLACVFVVRPAMNWIIKQTPKGKSVNNGYIFGVVLLALVSGVHEELVLFGPFVLGLVVPSGPPLGSTLVQKYDFMVSGVLMPLFVTNCVLMSDLRELRFDGKLLVLLVITMLAKFLGTLAPAMCCRIPSKDAFALAFIMSCKGAVEIGGFFMMYDGKSITDSVYALTMLMILFAHLTVAYAVKHLYKKSTRYAGYEQRNIINMRPNSELKILSCIHKQDNVSSVINLLDVACPTGENPIELNVLHLIEMTGQDAPMLISHRMQKKTTMSSSFDSDDVLVSFLKFEGEYGNAVEVHPFTAVWPSKWMSEQICTLALDRLTHLIIFPFHRLWTVDGAIKSEDETVRNINISVLDESPCTVGVLVNRGPLRQNNMREDRQAQFNVALIFLGGEDDREALALTGRMTGDPSIVLTVIHIMPPTQPEIGPGNDWDSVLDFESLRKFRVNNTGNGRYVIYREAVSESGEQTVDILREIVHKYDLFVVGRAKDSNPQSSGLDEWSEFPELGILGDLLASDDLGCRSSILVVQNQ